MIKRLKKLLANLAVWAIKTYRVASRQHKTLIWIVLAAVTCWMAYYIWSITAMVNLNLLIYDMLQLTVAFATGVVCDRVAFHRGGDPEDQVSEVAKAAVFVRRGIVVAAFVMGVSLSV